ncbi:MAG: rhodanese-like domain-containing protein [Desulfovibrio aminophilus]|jgi:rhodanese-related sulfurtransferase|uniref:rhodanese-like domain-containing protein n=1 Tax=Desulfovibrio aminophilus TaxID=81425 RepID=UPI0003F87357|nr:rhodanese-like domain-containing protein [Desulfovibrio aminophilus]MDY0306642.1 rhodanese-like domain-containing protein [Desulfovibrionaceae bacterium]
MTFRVLLLVMFLLAGAGNAWCAEAVPAWLEEARAQAAREGYTLIDRAGVQALLGGTSRRVILDVRPGYEFEEGHIPGAVNLEFDLGDERGLAPAKRGDLVGRLGPDRSVTVVVYCRSLQCVRSAIAARWAARLGYADVRRYVGGWRDYSTP